MHKSHLLAAFAFLVLSTLAGAAAAGPPKPGKKCSVANAGVASEDAPSSAWLLLGSALVGAAVIRRARR